MSLHLVLIALVGLIMLGLSVLPRMSSHYPLSVPIVFLIFGWIIFQIPLNLPEIRPNEHKHIIEYLTEIVIVISLTGAGLKIDRVPGIKNWITGWRLLVITMPLTILGGMLLSIGIMGFVPAAALLMSAMLAPTDPVLAADVQVNDPLEGPADDVRFGLTLEAGMNDGFTFPFVYLALIMLHGDSLAAWLVLDVGWRIVVGLLIGGGIGWSLAAFTFSVSDKYKLVHEYEGLIALAISFLVFSIAEVFNGYGFLAVFVAAIVFRWYAREHDYHERMEDFTNQVEHLLMSVVLILVGGAVADGVLMGLTVEGLIFSLLMLFLVRPVAGMIGLIGSDIPTREKWVISFFGIRGLATLYYVAFAFLHGEWANADLIWAIVAFNVVASVIMHGALITPVMDYLDRKRQQENDETVAESREETEREVQPA